jgi:malonyl-ACP decarboxylase
MPSAPSSELVVSGCGVLSAVGRGASATTAALLKGDHAFGVLGRPGRIGAERYLGAEIADLSVPDGVPRATLRTLGPSGAAALVALDEAWADARLSELDPECVGLVIGGSNVRQRELANQYGAYTDRPEFVPPSYAMTFLDSDLCGLCTERFGIRGLACTVGGASASGQLAVIEAARAVRCGEVDACIGLGALADLSHWEFQALRSIGAMGSDRFAGEPAAACRPFDEDHDGFIYGEACAAVVVESAASARGRGIEPHAELAGWSVVVDGNRNPNPSVAGQARAIGDALRRAGLPPEAIDYVNPHGTGSGLGDPTELDALRAAGLGHVALNATKSITGHSLTAAGAVEIVATVLQMGAATLHPTRNLDRPLDPSLNWVHDSAEPYEVTNALTLSLGFGGINSALCLRRTGA